MLVSQIKQFMSCQVGLNQMLINITPRVMVHLQTNELLFYHTLAPISSLFLIVFWSNIDDKWSNLLHLIQLCL